MLARACQSLACSACMGSAYLQSIVHLLSAPMYISQISTWLAKLLTPNLPRPYVRTGKTDH